MTATIQVWVQDAPDAHCPQCEVTTDFLERNKIPFEKHGLSEATPEQMDTFRTIGLSAPVVLTTTHGNWAGLRPEKLREVKKSYQTSKAAPPGAGPAIHQLTPTAGATGLSM
ncbi:hypothetical protein GCM10028787_31100 [Brachybacterium horti]